MNTISIIWLIFFILFLVLAICHFIASGKKIKPFRGIKGFAVEVIDGKSIKSELMHFADDFVNYVKKYNNQNRIQNLLTGIGYSLAALMALVSMYYQL